MKSFSPTELDNSERIAQLEGLVEGVVALSYVTDEDEYDRRCVALERNGFLDFDIISSEELIRDTKTAKAIQFKTSLPAAETVRVYGTNLFYIIQRGDLVPYLSQVCPETESMVVAVPAEERGYVMFQLHGPEVQRLTDESTAIA